MTTPIFPSVIAHNLLDGGTDAQDGNNYPGPLLSDYAAAVVGAVLGNTVVLADDASANTQTLQAAVDAAGPGGKVIIAANQGVVEIDSTVFHDNIIEVLAGTTLRLADGSTVSMFRNKNWNPTRTAVTGMTATGRSGVIDVGAAHTFQAGDHVSVLGFTNTGFNGVHPITAVGATTITVRLPRTPAVLTATGSGTISIVDETVGLIGLGEVDYNEANQAADGTMNTIQVVWANVVNAYVGDGLKVTNAKKFNFLIAGYRFCDVDNLRADTASDIIHFLGPGTMTRCSAVTGKSGDDSLAFTIGDVSWFNLSRGDFFNIEVDNLHTDSEQALVRISGNTGWKFYNVELKNLFGSAASSPVSIADFGSDLLGTQFDFVRVSGVNCETGTALPIVSYSTTSAATSARLIVENIVQLPSNGVAVSVTGSTTTLRSLDVNVSNPVDGCTAGAVLIGSGATVSSLSVEGIRASYGSNVFAVWVVGSCSEIRVSDCEVSGSGSRVVAQQGTGGRIMMDNIRHTSGFRTFEQSAAANANVEVLMSNIRSNSITNLAHFEKAATLVTSNVIVPSGGASGSVVSVNSAVTVTWRGDASYTGNTESTLTGGATLTKSSSVIA